MKAWRITLAAAGLSVLGYGAARLVLQGPPETLLRLALWLALAVVIHDALVSPGILLVGAALRRVPPRARTFLQGGLIAAALVTVIAVPMIDQAGQQPPSKALLLQHYGQNLAVLIGLIAAVSAIAYLLRRVRGTGRREPSPEA